MAKLKKKEPTESCKHCYVGRGRVVYNERNLFGETNLTPYTVFCDRCGIGFPGRTEEEAVDNWNEDHGIPKY